MSMRRLNSFLPYKVNYSRVKPRGTVVCVCPRRALWVTENKNERGRAGGGYKVNQDLEGTFVVVVVVLMFARRLSSL